MTIVVSASPLIQIVAKGDTIIFNFQFLIFNLKSQEDFLCLKKPK